MQNSKWFVQKTAEALIGKTGDLIGKKIASKIISVGKKKKIKEKKKKIKQIKDNKFTYHQKKGSKL